jgi:hypothetical protein
MRRRRSMREMRHAYDIYSENLKNRDYTRHGKPSRDPLGRYRGRQKYIKMGFKETGYEGVGLTNLATDRAQWKALATIVMNLRVP